MLWPRLTGSRDFGTRRAALPARMISDRKSDRTRRQINFKKIGARTLRQCPMSTRVATLRMHLRRQAPRLWRAAYRGVLDAFHDLPTPPSDEGIKAYLVW